ncbi:hypothetical protein [Planomonospora algeriensis]
MESRTHLHDLLVSTIFTEGLGAEMDLWALGFSALWIKGAGLATRTPCYTGWFLARHSRIGDLSQRAHTLNAPSATSVGTR